MSSVMIRCPTTGRAVATAVETEPSVFKTLPDIAARMRCPACGQEHVWPVRTAWLADAPSDGMAAPALVPLDNEAA